MFDVLLKRKIIRDFLSLYKEEKWEKLLESIIEFGIIVFRKKNSISAMSSDDIINKVEDIKRVEGIVEKKKDVKCFSKVRSKSKKKSINCSFNTSTGSNYSNYSKKSRMITTPKRRSTSSKVQGFSFSKKLRSNSSKKNTTFNVKAFQRNINDSFSSNSNKRNTFNTEKCAVSGKKKDFGVKHYMKPIKGKNEYQNLDHKLINFKEKKATKKEKVEVQSRIKDLIKRDKKNYNNKNNKKNKKKDDSEDNINDFKVEIVTKNDPKNFGKPVVIKGGPSPSSLNPLQIQIPSNNSTYKNIYNNNNENIILSDLTSLRSNNDIPNNNNNVNNNNNMNINMNIHNNNNINYNYGIGNIDPNNNNLLNNEYNNNIMNEQNKEYNIVSPPQNSTSISFNQKTDNSISSLEDKLNGLTLKLSKLNASINNNKKILSSYSQNIGNNAINNNIIIDNINNNINNISNNNNSFEGAFTHIETKIENTDNTHNDEDYIGEEHLINL